ncbi:MULTISPECIES: hypothetical protein [Enterococcus]|uniref:DUF3021 domain-containing protein n=1 Tax=Enterococcus malodoratus ATCC 43197 TaxID=1158601 RepID=R2R7N0_9ENTE|nr:MULTISPECIES: hypothetical protein [Enterococcus]BBM19477.1 hypothetical protein G15_3157 [Enterococcus avium]EOH71934.1 hypothetical protein UAI_04218 [Enterococcus malodoratus ATCC 43197]EOT70042.1 hypothetical protein I585_01521 [Enterococcus malodoratus ATCC 43197]OJG66245.1 hypothetical protein RV07_GL000038 [Enterococcus malodoratus]SET08662.1 hypothetical protein SAMN04487821_1063 [Enterococcus malodoratus]
MNKWVIIREITIIFSFIFSLSIIFALFTGANLTSESVFSILVFSIVLGIGCTIFYIDPLVDFLGIFWVQVVYLSLIFTAFIVCSQVFVWNVPPMIIGLAFVVMVVGFFIGKTILFSVSVKMTEQMNRQLKKKFQKRDNE